MSRATPANPCPRTPPPAPAAPRLLLRPSEAAASLGISERTLMSMISAGDVPVTRIGERCLRLPLDGLRQWVARRTQWPAGAEIVPGGSELSAANAADVGVSGSGAAAGAANQQGGGRR